MEKQSISYIYTDEKETPLYKQNRYYKDDGTKSFYSEKIENGEWKKGLEGVQKVLFKLPLVLKGIQEKKNIFFVEGEKDVLTLINKGKIATTIAGGANQKWLPSYTASLKGADVVIIPDNDKVGQEFGRRVAESIKDEVKSVKLLDLTKKFEIKEKEDITDVFEKVNNDEEVLKKLDELINETSPYIKIKKATKSKPKEERYTIPKLGIERNVPFDYDISEEKGIRCWRNNKVKPISPIPIVITKILKSLDTGEEKIEICYYYQKKDWKKLIVDKNVISSKNNITILSKDGIPVTTTNAKDLVDWFYNLEISNYEKTKIEYTTSKMGWIDKKTFIPFRNGDVSLDLEKGIKGWLQNIGKKKGNIEGWQKHIKEFLDNDENGYIRFFLGIRF